MVQLPLRTSSQVQRPHGSRPALHPSPRPPVLHQEIIELPVVLLDVASGQQVAQFQTYVRPAAHPRLTPFCTSACWATGDGRAGHHKGPRAAEWA